MRIALYDFLENVGFIEVEVFKRLENGEDKPLFIGYPEELQEHLILSFSTYCYDVFYIRGINNNVLEIVVTEEIWPLF